MLRISKNTNKIVSIQMSTKQEVPEGYTPPEIDSFVIIPGVTQYNNIYTKGNWLVFDSHDSYIGVQFSDEVDLERFFIQLMRDIKLNQITNVSIDTKTN
jgi:hypothetical protein